MWSAISTHMYSQCMTLASPCSIQWGVSIQQAWSRKTRLSIRTAFITLDTMLDGFVLEEKKAKNISSNDNIFFLFSHVTIWI